MTSLAWVLALAGLLSERARGADRPDAAAPLERAVAAADGSLRKGERETAQRQYRAALVQGWLLRGALETASGRLPQARESLRRATETALVDPPGSPPPALAPPSLQALDPSARQALGRRVAALMARVCLNLGVIEAQDQHFSPAAVQFETAAELDPSLPKVQYSLGVAYFNAQDFGKAAGPLTRARAEAPADPEITRMLALAWLNTEAYAKAAELLKDDPGREENPSLQYAYGLALVRSDRGAEAEEVFSRLLSRHGDTPEINVLLGQAHAQQGDYEGAIRSLQQALALKPDVAEAHATLGLLHLKRGELAEAEAAFRAETRTHPNDLKALFNLATVLDLQGQGEEALALVRSVLQVKPDFADARYLLGKLLLAQGTTEEAAFQLEAAARLSPGDANIHYQLGQAYQKLGRTEAAREQFEVFRTLKEKRRGTADGRLP